MVYFIVLFEEVVCIAIKKIIYDKNSLTHTEKLYKGKKTKKVGQLSHRTLIGSK